MAKTYGQHCALARALDRIGERWTLLVVRELLLGPARYTDLRAALPGMATNLLADRLRALEADGIVARRTLPPPATTTVYELTELGRGLDEPVQALIRWGGHWMREAPGERDVFRPQWLALAVRALSARGTDDGLPLTVRLHVGGERFTLALGDGPPEVTAGEGVPADVRLATDPRTMLAVASGARSLEEAIAGGDVACAGDEDAVAALAGAWRPAARAA